MYPPPPPPPPLPPSPPLSRPIDAGAISAAVDRARAPTIKLRLRLCRGAPPRVPSTGAKGIGPAPGLPPLTAAVAAAAAAEAEEAEVDRWCPAYAPCVAGTMACRAASMRRCAWEDRRWRERRCSLAASSCAGGEGRRRVRVSAACACVRGSGSFSPFRCSFSALALRAATAHKEATGHGEGGRHRWRRAALFHAPLLLRLSSEPVLTAAAGQR